MDSMCRLKRLFIDLYLPLFLNFVSLQAACQVLGILWVALVILKGRESTELQCFQLPLEFSALFAGETGD
jgi:hypothetical protein